MTKHNYFQNIKYLHIIAFAFALALFIATTNAQQQQDDEDGTSCPVFVSSAMEIAQSLCNGITSNSACYGHDLIDAQIRQNDLRFNVPGDQVGLVQVDSIRLSALDTVTGIWGVARLQIQATATASQLSDLDILVFGDVEVENEVEARTRINAVVSLDEEEEDTQINLRLLPDLTSYVVVSLEQGTTVVATGQTTSGDWIRIEVPSLSLTGWIAAEYLESEADLTALPLQSPSDPYFGPMQAFSFTSASDAADACSQTPVDGLLLQTPEGPAQVRVFINEINIDLLPSTSGNTVFVGADTAGNTTVSVLEGSAFVGVDGVGYTAIDGSQVTVSVNAGDSSTRTVSEPQPYADGAFGYYPVEVSPPATETEIEEAVSSPWMSPEGDEGTTTASSETTDSTPLTDGDFTPPPAAATDDDDDDDDDDDSDSSDGGDGGGGGGGGDGGDGEEPDDPGDSGGGGRADRGNRGNDGDNGSDDNRGNDDNFD